MDSSLKGSISMEYIVSCITIKSYIVCKDADYDDKSLNKLIRKFRWFLSVIFKGMIANMSLCIEEKFCPSI